MRIAVIGGGTAGFIAAAHVTRSLPEAELLHVFDSSIPTIGVGEGTTPRFPVWLEEVTGLGFSDLAERCGATLKNGTRFDGWGVHGSEFVNRFQPVRLIGYHFDATKVVRVIGEHVRAQHIDARVDELRTLPHGVLVTLGDRTTHLCDYVFDARGFPRPAAEAPGDLIQLDWIPTSRANLRWLPPGALSGVTRAAARPHGWIFHIPLQDATSTGYIFNPSISSDAEVEADFTLSLKEEGVTGWTHRGMLNFPNFLRRRFFDGRIFWVGNSASFLEPLEATGIATAIVEIRSAAHWIAEHGPESSTDLDELEAFNEGMVGFVCRNSLFVAWHYACGSLWDTAFWRYARQGMERAREQRRRPGPSRRNGGIRGSGTDAASPRALRLQGSGDLGQGGLSALAHLPALRQFLGAQFCPGRPRNRLLRHASTTGGATARKREAGGASPPV